ncbi:MAG: TolC family protein [Bacteroidota bacterium]
MKRHLHLFLVLGMSTLPMLLSAQSSDIWSLRQCLEYAQEYNLQLKQADLNVQRGEIDLAQARAARMPNLNGSVNGFSRFGFFVDPFTNQLDQQSSFTSDLGISSGVTLFNGFQLSNTIKQSELDYRASLADKEQQEYDLALNITLAYLSILQNAEFAEAAKLQVASTKEQRDRTSKLVEAGSLAPADLLQLQSQIASEELNVVNLQNQLELSYLNLQQLMNLDPSEPFGIEKLELDDPEGEVLDMNTSDLYAEAEQNQPFIESADLQIQSAQMGKEIAKGAQYPSLFLSMSGGTGYSSNRKRVLGFEQNGFDELPGVKINGEPALFETPALDQVTGPYAYFDQLSDNVSGNVSVGLNIPIYNRRQIKSGIELADIQIQNAQLSAQLQRQNLKQVIEQAYLDAKSSYSSYLATQRQLDAAQLNFENVEKQFNVGLSNSVDYLVAKNSANMARFDLLRNKYTYLFRTKVLDFYQGKPIGF